jgi:hypothetical protein
MAQALGIRGGDTSDDERKDTLSPYFPTRISRISELCRMADLQRIGNHLSDGEQ